MGWNLVMAEFLRAHPEFPDGEEGQTILYQRLLDDTGLDLRSEARLVDFEGAWEATRVVINTAASEANFEKFLEECPAYPQTLHNNHLLGLQVATQVGSYEERAWTVENYHAAFEFLAAQGLLQAEEEEVEPEAATRDEAPRGDTVELTDERELHKLRHMPLKALKILAVKQRRALTDPHQLRLSDAGALGAPQI